MKEKKKKQINLDQLKRISLEKNTHNHTRISTSEHEHAHANESLSFTHEIMMQRVEKLVHDQKR